jgi:hypothetical protein
MDYAVETRGEQTESFGELNARIHNNNTQYLHPASHLQMSDQYNHSSDSSSTTKQQKEEEEQQQPAAKKPKIERRVTISVSASEAHSFNGESSPKPEHAQGALRADGKKYVEKGSLTEAELVEAKSRSKLSKGKDQMTEDEKRDERRAANRLSAFQSRHRRMSIIEDLQVHFDPESFARYAWNQCISLTMSFFVF